MPLAHARAQAVVDTLNELVRSAARAADLRGVADGSCVLCPPGASPSPPQPPIRFMVDPCTNSVLFRVALDDRLRLRELIERLDVEGFGFSH